MKPAPHAAEPRPVLLLLLVLVTTLASAPAPASSAESERFAARPLVFEANRGQAPQEVSFVSRGRGHVLYLTAAEAVFDLTGLPAADAEAVPAARSVVCMRFDGASHRSSLDGQGELPGRASYFIGSDSKRWVRGAPQYERVRQRAIYPGIDVVYYGREGELEYDLVVAAGADPRAIALRFEGARDLQVAPDGALVMTHAGGAMRFRAPVAYQPRGATRRPIECRYALAADGRVAFALGAYDRSAPLVIDPVLVYSSYLGRGGIERLGGIAVDASGNLYVTGITYSLDFPTANPRQPSLNGTSDRFVTKLDPSGALVYSTFLGGSGGEAELRGAIAVDAGGNAYVTGATRSTDFPVTAGAIKTTLSGAAFDDQDGFFVKLDPSGQTLLYATYLGGNGSDEGIDLAIDGSGNAYLTGLTTSTDFPVANAFQPATGGDRDAFVTKFATTPPALVYSSYLGGNWFDWGLGIAVDAAGSAYVTGQTGSPDFVTTPGAFQTTSQGIDAYVVKVSPSGTSRVYATFVAGTRPDFGIDVAVDGAGSAFVTGGTESYDFPTSNAFDGAKDLDGQEDAFVVALNPTGTALVFGTFLGGLGADACAGLDVGTGIALDGAGRIHVTGYTGTCDFPTVAPVQCQRAAFSVDAFLTVFDPTGASPVFSTFFGGSRREYETYFHEAFTGGRVAVAPGGIDWIAGFTESDDFPVRNALQPTAPGGFDVFVAKFDLNAGGPQSCDVSVEQLESNDPVTIGFPVTYNVVIRNAGPSCAASVVVRDQYPPTMSFNSAYPSRGSCHDSSGTIVCAIGTVSPADSISMTVTLNTHAIGQALNVVTATTATPDVDGSNNTSTESTTVEEQQVADVFARQSHPAEGSAGADLRFVIQVGNHGPDEARGVVLYHQIYGVPATPVSITSSRGSCTGDSLYPNFLCNFGTMAPGDSATIEIVVTPRAEGELYASLYAASAVLDPNPSNSGSFDVVAIRVSPAELIQALVDRIEDLRLIHGVEVVLTGWLERARDGFAEGDIPGACSDLAHFHRMVRNFPARVLSPVQAADLDSAAVAIAAVLGCSGGAPSGGGRGVIAAGVAFGLRVSNRDDGHTRIRLSLPAREHARVDVFDVGGRLVRTAFEGDLAPGHHEIAWDGRGAGGAPLGAGIYFLRAAAGSNRAVGRLVLVR